MELNQPLDNLAEMQAQSEKVVKTIEDVLEEVTPQSELIDFVNQRYSEARNGRTQKENDWLRDWYLFRGEYSPAEQAKFAEAVKHNPGASKVFIKVTKTKAMAVYSQLLEVLLSDNKFPIGIEHTPVPEGVPETVHLSTGGEASPTPVDLGFEGDGNELQPGDTANSFLTGLYAKFKDKVTVNEGPSSDPTAVELDPAKRAANKLEKTMHDQLLESSALTAFKKSVLEFVIFGSGIIKGPFNSYRIVDRWDEEDGEIKYKPIKQLFPDFQYVSIWDFYPDPSATTIEDAEYVVEKGRYSASQLRKLASHPSYNKEGITNLLILGPQIDEDDANRHLLRDEKTLENNRYHYKEYWGPLSVDLARRLGLEVDDIPDIVDIVQVQAITCGPEVIKLVVNPFLPTHIPYASAPYERNLFQIWGTSVPENMEDTQELMNGHMRMAIDNLKLAGQVMLEVNENYLKPGHDMSIYAGKIWRKTGGAPGQTIYPISFNNTAQSHFFAFDKARQLADESVGVPSFSHGMTGVQGVGRTAGGISMLMSAAQLGIKTAVGNIDTDMLKPIGEKLFRWNMQFNNIDKNIRGDYKIVARGTTALMAREVRSQRLLSFGQVTLSNPATAPRIDVDYWLQELAKSSDLDPDKILNDMEASQLQAQLIQQAGGIGNGQGISNEALSPTQGGQQASPDSAIQGDGLQTQTSPTGGSIGVGASQTTG